jgi:beta-glucosidase
VDRPVKELKDYQQITLEPGEEKVVEFTLNRSAFAFYDDKENRWKVESGEFIIMAGSSSRDIRLKKKITVN